MRNLKLILLVAVILSSLNQVKGQESPFKYDEIADTSGSTDSYIYRYQDMDIDVNFEKMYVFDEEDYNAKSYSISSQYDAHYTVSVTHPEIVTINKVVNSFTVNLPGIEENDTITVVTFDLDSLYGESNFTRYLFIGRKRGTPVSIQQIESLREISIYPTVLTPENSNINIPCIKGGYEYGIYTLNGQQVIGGEKDINEINVQMLLPGSYILYIKDNSQEYSKQFIKL